MMHQNLPLRQRLPKKTLGEVSTNTTSNAEVQHSEYRRISPEYWSRTYRKEFPKFKIFLDNLEDKYSKPLERKIKLLGAHCEVFFGQQCTHVVTMKPFYDELPRDSVDAAPTTITSHQDQENIPVKPTTNNSTNETKANFPMKPNIAKDPSQQPFFDRAHKLGIDVWSLSKMNYVVGALMNKPATHGTPIHRGTRHENLDKLLLEEKRYGVSTGHRNGQAPRPTYVTFNEHYIKVEDVAGVHCPILVKEFHTPTFDPDIPEIDRVYPWPKLYVKKDVHVRSPFAIPDPHPKSKKPNNPAASMQSSKKHTPLQIQQQQQQQQQIPVQTHSTIAMPPPATTNPNKNTLNPCIPPNTFTHHNNNNNNNNQSQQDQHMQDVEQYQQNNHYQNMDQENLTTPAPTFDPVGPASADLSQMKTPNTIYQSHFTQTSKSTNTHTPAQILSNTPEKNATFRRSGASLYENMSRMDRRMVSNQRTTGLNHSLADAGHGEATKMNGGADYKSQSKKVLSITGSTAAGCSQVAGLRPPVAAKTAHDQAERRKKDLARRLAKENSKYCENCVTYYQDLDKHLQDESHQAFVRDKNNFKELDLVLESTRRLRRQVE